MAGLGWMEAEAVEEMTVVVDETEEAGRQEPDLKGPVRRASHYEARGGGTAVGGGEFRLLQQQRKNHVLGRDGLTRLTKREG